jgi:hypothetical protein
MVMRQESFETKRVTILGGIFTLLLIASLAPALGKVTKVDWKWAIQCMYATHSLKSKERIYQMYYIKAGSDKSVFAPLPLPKGGVIVLVMANCNGFWLQDEKGHIMRFKNADEAKGKVLPPGTWGAYPNPPPMGSSTVLVYIK